MGGGHVRGHRHHAMPPGSGNNALATEHPGQGAQWFPARGLWPIVEEHQVLLIHDRPQQGDARVRPSHRATGIHEVERGEDDGRHPSLFVQHGMREDHIGIPRNPPNLEPTDGRLAPSDYALQPFPVPEGHRPPGREWDGADHDCPIGGDEGEVLEVRGVRQEILEQPFDFLPIPRADSG